MPADQSLYMPEANVDFYEYDVAGRILQQGRMARGYVMDHIAAGRRYGIGAVNDVVNYIDTSSGQPVVRERPVIDWAFDKNSVLPMEEASLPNVPPAVVLFRGPSNGQQTHDTFGPVKIGWTTPGDYVVSVDAFPYRPATFPITVKGKLPISLNLGVNL